MAFITRSLVCNKIIQAVSGFPIGGRGLKPSSILPFIKISPENTSEIEYELNLNQKQYGNAKHESRTLPSEISWDGPNLVEKIQLDNTVTGAYLDEKSKLRIKVCSKKIIREVLDLLCERPASFWKSSALFSLSPKQKVIVEYSSPNIAKPFHMGHLRSTIVGNFIGNLHQALGHDVTRLNYLGDWGTQFGILKYGYDARNMSKKDLETNPIKKLYDLYVWSNAEAEKSPEVRERAKDIFRLMEKGDEASLEAWKTFRDFSIKEFEQVYQRLNVNFDEYQGESMYGIECSDEVLGLMEKRGMLEHLEDGRRVYRFKERNLVATIIKSDGSTMYITRDLAAAIHRFNTYKFDKMFYVVDNSQHDHFATLFRILEDLGFDWAKNLCHVKFGRIQGMSTRQGTAVFLQDVLDEAKDLTMAKQVASENTAFEDGEEGRKAADVVGASTIIVADLKRRRKKDYKFRWDSALQSNGETGMRLQYAHCRLVRLERNCGIQFNPEADTESLVEPEIITLVRTIARFDEVLFQSYEELESCVLVTYLFELSTALNKVYLKVPVKGAPQQMAEDRLKLFRAARHALGAGMSILGLSPLDRM